MAWHDISFEPFSFYDVTSLDPTDVAANVSAANLQFAVQNTLTTVAANTNRVPANNINYDNALDRPGVVNALMKIASDGMKEYLVRLRAAQQVAIDSYVADLKAGRRAFINMPRDVALHAFREMRDGALTRKHAFVEANVTMQYHGIHNDKAPSWILEQVASYPKITAAITSMQANVVPLTSARLAAAVSANSSAETAAYLNGNVFNAVALPVRARTAITLYLQSLGLLVRSVEPARRLAAGPLYALVHLFWRRGEAGMTYTHIFDYAGDFSVMSHKGAASKVRGQDDARDLRKTKGANIFKKLLSLVGVNTNYVHDRSNNNYDLMELANGIRIWLELMEASINRDEFIGVDPPPRVREAGLINALPWFDVLDEDDVRAVYRDRGGRSTVRFWWRNEGPELSNRVSTATAMLKNLFVGLMISENGRWQ